ncbi:unannotated protein [freshwater metagenome]|uniref:Unannotated protein n=1 Tax=freshwater metagenome TaxID=449393 RepID=A0A6J7IAH9_9ZZZZ
MAGRRLAGIAVHRVADPHDRNTARVDLLDDAGQDVAHGTGAHPGDEGEPARDPLGIEDLGELDDLVRRCGRAHLDTDRVSDLGGEVHVGSIELAGALADPQEMTGNVVRQAGTRVDAGQGSFVVDRQCLVCGIELDPLKLIGVGAARMHE